MTEELQTPQETEWWLRALLPPAGPPVSLHHGHSLNALVTNEDNTAFGTNNLLIVV